MTSLRNRILLFFTLFAVVSLLAVFMSGRSTHIVGEAANSVVNNHLPMVQSLEEMETALIKHDAALYRYVTTRAPEWMDVMEKERINYNRWYVEAYKHAEADTEIDKLNAVDEVYIRYENQIRKIMLATQDGSRLSKGKLASVDDLLMQIKSYLNEIQSFRHGMTVVRQQQISDTLDRHARFALYFLLTIVIFFIVLAVYLLQFLVKPLSLLLDGIRNFTRGRLDIQIPPVGKDELGELQEAFNEMSREIALERKRLKTESQSDSLTGLFNMRYFKRQLADEFSRSKRYAHPLTLLMIDVDNFKSYNDRNGHPAGDIVLKEVSRILIRNVRGTDVVARYGGEEFVIMLPETHHEAARKVAEKIRKAVEHHHFPFQGHSSAKKLTISVGLASYPDSKVTSDQDLIEASDKALYNAKNNGRNQVSIYTGKSEKKPALSR